MKDNPFKVVQKQMAVEYGKSVDNQSISRITHLPKTGAELSKITRDRVWAEMKEEWDNSPLREAFIHTCPKCGTEVPLEIRGTEADGTIEEMMRFALYVLCDKCCQYSKIISRLRDSRERLMVEVHEEIVKSDGAKRKVIAADSPEVLSYAKGEANTAEQAVDAAWEAVAECDRKISEAKDRFNKHVEDSIHL
jgi:hypothetical protein